MKEKGTWSFNRLMFVSEVLLALLAYGMLYEAGYSVIGIGIGILIPLVEAWMLRRETGLRRKILWGLLAATLLVPIIYWLYLVLSVTAAELR